jgi:hypothetical protein
MYKDHIQRICSPEQNQTKTSFTPYRKASEASQTTQDRARFLNKKRPLTCLDISPLGYSQNSVKSSEFTAPNQLYIFGVLFAELWPGRQGLQNEIPVPLSNITCTIRKINLNIYYNSMHITMTNYRYKITRIKPHRSSHNWASHIHTHSTIRDVIIDKKEGERPRPRNPPIVSLQIHCNKTSQSSCRRYPDYYIYRSSPIESLQTPFIKIHQSPRHVSPDDIFFHTPLITQSTTRVANSRHSNKTHGPRAANNKLFIDSSTIQSGHNIQILLIQEEEESDSSNKKPAGGGDLVGIITPLHHARRRVLINHQITTLYQN